MKMACMGIICIDNMEMKMVLSYFDKILGFMSDQIGVIENDAIKVCY